jgi:aspartate carbamoyltransferase catalytic subunit
MSRTPGRNSSGISNGVFAGLAGADANHLFKFADENLAVEEAIEWADALNVLRLQLERMQAGYIPSLREYNRVFGVTRERLERGPRDLIIMHPGPINRVVEIDSDVADGPHSVILDQVTNGVAVRMAVLYLLAGTRSESTVPSRAG